MIDEVGSRLRVAVLGAGLIGVDLLERINSQEWLQCVLVAGRRHGTAGLRRVAELGVPVSDGGVVAVVELARAGGVDVVFDASDAATHVGLAEQLASTPARIIDLTPSHLGTPVVPTANGHDAQGAADLSLVSCAGQAAVPVIDALARRFAVSYTEVVATAASVTAGPATRRNLDQFVRTTASAVSAITGVERVKVMANVSPAHPRPPFRVVVRVLAERVGQPLAVQTVRDAEMAVQVFVPGYRVVAVDVEAGRRTGHEVGDLVSAVVEVTPSNHRLPGYAGNLEIINAAALHVADRLAAAAIPFGSLS